MAETLLGHLATFASFFGQGELLCAPRPQLPVRR